MFCFGVLWGFFAFFVFPCVILICCDLEYTEWDWRNISPAQYLFSFFIESSRYCPPVVSYITLIFDRPVFLVGFFCLFCFVLGGGVVLGFWGFFCFFLSFRVLLYWWVWTDWFYPYTTELYVNNTGKITRLPQCHWNTPIWISVNKSLESPSGWYVNTTKQHITVRIF